jgi:hypothetical protein
LTGRILYFFSHEPNEPPHVHVDRDELSAKFWLDPVELARNLGFRAHELNRLERLVQENRRDFLEAWNEHIGA